MILLNDFKRQWADTGADTLAAVEAVGSSGWYILGEEVRQFEAALAKLCGVEHAIGVASGLDALELSLAALGCGPGAKVLTTPVSAFATTLAILKLGATPVFVDCDPCGLIDLDACEAALQADPEIRYLVPVHLYGHALDLTRLESIARSHDVAIVEDCAQSILASSAGRPVGTVGRAAALSFYPTKNLGALGDGGAVLTNDAEIASSIRSLRDYGQTAKYRHSVIGYNSRLDELHAAILRRAHLPRLDAWTATRRRIAAEYRARIRNPRVSIPGAPVASDSVWHLFPVLVPPDRKPAFLDHLRARSIATAEHYPTSIPDQPAMHNAHHVLIGDCQTARRLCASEVSLPIHPYLTADEVAAVIDACNAWAG